MNFCSHFVQALILSPPLLPNSTSPKSFHLDQCLCSFSCWSKFSKLWGYVLHRHKTIWTQLWCLWYDVYSNPDTYHPFGRSSGILLCITQVVIHGIDMLLVPAIVGGPSLHALWSLLALIGGSNLTNRPYGGIRRIGCLFHILQGLEMDRSPWGADPIMVGNQLQRMKLLILLVTSLIHWNGKYFHWLCIIHDMSSWISFKYRKFPQFTLNM